MASNLKKAQQTARQFFRLSLVEGLLSPERVAGVLEYIEAHPLENSLQVLKAYHRLIAAEVAKGQAVVEHAGSVDNAILKTIAASLSKQYNRPVTAVAKANPSLIAGLRVRVGDDVYESSVAGRLQALSSAL